MTLDGKIYMEKEVKVMAWLEKTQAGKTFKILKEAIVKRTDDTEDKEEKETEKSS